MLAAVLASMAQPAAAQDATVALEARRAEPIVFDIMRQLRVMPVGQGRLRLRSQLDLWRARAHDGSVKVGGQWLDAKELQRRRERYIVELAAAEAVARQIPRRDPTTPEERLARDRLYTNLGQKLQQAARVWADPLIRNFLTGQVALMTGDDRQAERLFDQCIREQPMIAGFYQGRAMARGRLDKSLDAAADWVALSRLRPDSPIVIQGLRDALADVPGGMITTRAFKDAAVRLKEIEDNAPPRRSFSTRRGAAWLMPGGDWTGDVNSLPTPACDMFFTRKTVAVPITDSGVLLVDKAALDGAMEMLLEIAPGEFVPAELGRVSSRASRDLDLPLAAVRVEGLSFQPATMAEEPAIAEGEKLTCLLHSLPGEMDAGEPRSVETRVESVGDDGAPALRVWGRAGESGGPAFGESGRLVSWVVGRTDPFADGGGPPKALAPADLAKYIDVAKRAGRRSSLTYGRPRKPDAASRPVQGRTFTLHIIAGKGVQESKRRGLYR